MWTGVLSTVYSFSFQFRFFRLFATRWQLLFIVIIIIIELILFYYYYYYCYYFHNNVRWQLQKQEGDLTKTAEALVAAAFVRGTADNTSAIICALNQVECAEEGIDLSTAVCPVIPPSLRPLSTKLNRSSLRL